MKSCMFSFVACGLLNVRLYYCRTQVYEVNVLLSKPFSVAIIHFFLSSSLAVRMSCLLYPNDCDSI